mmetsp:Transcript_41128/g.49893  ORF Transcript_41128/g.49893 Transcript_41128/m.49893 type:complete len:85 (-) Transcript_41128:776-1030(-)
MCTVLCGPHASGKWDHMTDRGLVRKPPSGDREGEMLVGGPEGRAVMGRRRQASLESTKLTLKEQFGLLRMLSELSFTSREELVD